MELNREHLAALAVLPQNLGWKVLEAHFGDVRRETVKAVMSSGLRAEERERLVLIQAGRDEVLRWAEAMIEQAPSWAHNCE
jgi:hypothetical protein